MEIGDFKIFAIVASYNGSQWTDRCLTSLRQSSYPVKTIVIDNGSTDGSLEYIRNSYPEVTVHANTTNIGFGAANNRGISKALAMGASHIFLLNQDAWIEPDTIGGLVSVASQNPRYGVVSPMHFTGHGDHLDHNFEFYLRRDYPEATIDQWLVKPSFEINPSQFINAAGWLVTCECLERVGGFGSLFFHYGEDYDFVHRMKFFDLELGFTSAVRIYHDRENRIREDFRTSVESLDRYFYVGSLVRMADPRRALRAATLYTIWWNLKELSVLFFKGTWKAPAVYAMVLTRIVKNFPVIRTYRQTIVGEAKFRFLQ